MADKDPSILQDLHNLLRKLSLPADDQDDLAAQMQHLCEAFWSALDGEEKESDITSVDVCRFIRILLKDNEGFMVAQLVIQELRGEPVEGSLGNRRKQQVVTEVKRVREEMARIRGATQSDFDDVLYTEEKDTLRGAYTERVD